MSMYFLQALGRKWSAYAITLAGLIACVLLKAPLPVLENLAMAVTLGLPVLLGGQAAVDHKKAAKPHEPDIGAS